MLPPEENTPFPPPQSYPASFSSPPAGETAPPLAPNQEPLAGLLERAGAVLVDCVILTVIGTLLGLVSASLLLINGQALSASGASVEFYVNLGVQVLAFLLTIAYLLLTMLRAGPRHGQTLGRQLLKVAVIRADGGEIGAGRILWREVGAKAFPLLGGGIIFTIALILLLPHYQGDGFLEELGAVLWAGVAGLFASVVLFMLDYLWAVWDPRRQTLHDKLAQTLVVTRLEQGEPALISSHAPPPAPV